MTMQRVSNPQELRSLRNVRSATIILGRTECSRRRCSEWFSGCMQFISSTGSAIHHQPFTHHTGLTPAGHSEFHPREPLVAAEYGTGSGARAVQRCQGRTVSSAVTETD